MPRYCVRFGMIIVVDEFLDVKSVLAVWGLMVMVPTCHLSLLPDRIIWCRSKGV